MEEQPKIGRPEALQICLLFDQGHSIRTIANLYNTDRKYILQITMGNRWGGITGRKPEHTIMRNRRMGRETTYLFRPARQHSK